MVGATVMITLSTQVSALPSECVMSWDLAAARKDLITLAPPSTINERMPRSLSCVKRHGMDIQPTSESKKSKYHRRLFHAELTNRFLLRFLWHEPPQIQVPLSSPKTLSSALRAYRGRWNTLSKVFALFLLCNSWVICNLWICANTNQEQSDAGHGIYE